MALINPCDITVVAGKNTGVECSSALGIPKGFYLVSPNDTWTESDLADTAAFFKTRIHASGSGRWFPVLKGAFAFAQAVQSDVTEANELTGTTTIVRAGGFTLTYTFKDGGLCLAKALKAFEGSGYSFFIVDNIKQILFRKNADGTLSGLQTSDISSSILPATGTTKFKNVVVFGVSQDEYINYAELYKSDDNVSDFNGLIDSEVYKAGTPTTTKLKVGLRTECAKSDIVAKFPSVANDLDLYIITDKATGAVNTPASAAVVNSIVEITGTFITGHTYIVKGSAASVWKTNLIEGYDASVQAKAILSEHLIP